MSGEEKKYWLDDHANVKKVIITLSAIFGFVVCVALVLAAKWLRTLLMRPEDYYDAE